MAVLAGCGQWISGPYLNSLGSGGVLKPLPDGGRDFVQSARRGADRNPPGLACQQAAPAIGHAALSLRQRPDRTRELGMKLTHEEVRQVLSIIEESAFDTIEIRMGDITLSASKSGPLRTVSAQPAAPAEAVAPPAPAPAPQSIAAPAAPAPQKAASPAPATEEGLVEIPSPMVGVFYVAPEPGADPFVKEGDTINAESTIGIIEVMKVFTNIRAEKSGTIVKCLVQNGDFVEFGQPLLLIRPEA
nr:acetyl-CoA carboxylase [uncultured bacterium]BAH90573.1 acetyl-CoA carboxylase [uncultured bacterium]